MNSNFSFGHKLKLNSALNINSNFIEIDKAKQIILNKKKLSDNNVNPYISTYQTTYNADESEEIYYIDNEELKRKRKENNYKSIKNQYKILMSPITTPFLNQSINFNTNTNQRCSHCFEYQKLLSEQIEENNNFKQESIKLVEQISLLLDSNQMLLNEVSNLRQKMEVKKIKEELEGLKMKDIIIERQNKQINNFNKERKLLEDQINSLRDTISSYDNMFSKYYNKNKMTYDLHGNDKKWIIREDDNDITLNSKFLVFDNDVDFSFKSKNIIN